MKHPRLKEICPIELFPHQVEHTQKIWDLLVKDRAFSYIDTSETGLGKTITTLWIAWHMERLYGTKPFIIAPSDNSLNNDDGWYAHAKAFGIEVIDGLTYHNIRTKSSKKWLVRNAEKKKVWTATKEFEEECKAGIFLIFDEFHNTKNPTMTHFAAAALVKVAKKHRDTSRCALLSHTPGDKPDAFPQVLRMTGFIASNIMLKHIPFTRDYEWSEYGLGELMKVCKKIAPDEHHQINMHFHQINKARSFTIAKNLYKEYIHDRITFSMPVPDKEYKVEKLNVFLQTDPDSLKIVNDGVNLLSGAVGWDSVRQEVADKSQWKIGNISKALQLIEKGKLPSIARYIREETKKFGNKRFIVCCGARGIAHQHQLAEMIYQEYQPYREILDELRSKSLLWKKLPKDMFNYISKFIVKPYPVFLNGEVDKKERVKVLRRFQADWDDAWCLILSPGVGSESISLHDKHGGRPREMLIIPDYFFSRNIQAVGRINRIGVQSDTKSMFVYSKEANLETSILNSMVVKSKVARSLMAEDQEVTYPSEFDFWIEGDKNQELEDRLTILQRM